MLDAGVMTDELRNFLDINLPKVKEGKKAKFSLGLAEPKIGSHIFEVTKIPCQSNEFVLELLRGVRLHFDRFIKDLKVFIFFSFEIHTHHICTYPCSKYSWFYLRHECLFLNSSLSIFSSCSSLAWGYRKSPAWSRTQLQQSESQV